ncbi:MAG: tetratricopeptide repeat protein [Xanthobacteraceae bacterium]|jgi:Flp pilus assembly protein TadD
MSIRVGPVVVVVAACLTALGGCSSMPKMNDLWATDDLKTGSTAPSNSAATATAPAPAAGDTTGSVSTQTQPAESGPSGEPVAPLASPGLVGDAPDDDLQKGKRYFRANNFGLAEKSFRAAAEKHPNDAEAWVGLASSYDRLHRFDLADRAYAQAIRLIGPTPEILNDQGFSYMLRGDYVRARQKLLAAQARDPGNPYVHANLQLLQESAVEGKGVQ